MASQIRNEPRHNLFERHFAILFRRGLRAGDVKLELAANLLAFQGLSQQRSNFRLSMLPIGFYSFLETKAKLLHRQVGNVRVEFLSPFFCSVVVLF